MTKHRQERRYRRSLRTRSLRRTGVILFEYGEVVLISLLDPLLNRVHNVKLQLGEPREVRHCVTYVSVVGSIRLGLPLRLRQCLLIFQPGLLKEEALKRKVRRTGSVRIVIVGCRRSRKVFLPWMVSFLINFSNETRNQEVRYSALRISSTVDLVMKRIRALILRLHVPRVVRIMGKEIGREIKVNNNRSNRRRSFIIRARVVGAIVTPPDVVSQVIVAIPIRVLRERGIFLKCVRLSRNEQEDKSNK